MTAKRRSVRKPPGTKGSGTAASGSSSSWIYISTFAITLAVCGLAAIAIMPGGADAAGEDTAGEDTAAAEACPSPDAPWAERDAWRAAHPVLSARSAASAEGEDEAAEWKAAIAAGDVTYAPFDDPAEAMGLLGTACAAGDLAGVQRALAHGAHPAPAVYGDDGRTPRAQEGTTGGTNPALLVAALNGHAHVARFLIAVGADPDAGDTLFGTTYATPAHAACDKGHADVVRVLLALGADAGVATKEGKRTPAMLAAMRGHVGCLRALGEGATGGGADGAGHHELASVNAVNDYGRTALDYAEMRRRTEAAAFLRDELGAKLGKDIAKTAAAFAADVKTKKK